MLHTLAPPKLVLYFLVTYSSAGEEKSILILQGCAFLLLGLLLLRRSRCRRQGARLRINDVSLEVSSRLLATQLLDIADGFSTRQTPPSQSSPSQKSIFYRPKLASTSARSASTR